MEHIRIEIKGVSIKYAELKAEEGYCFYDVNEKERNYLTAIATPIVDINKLAETYIVVEGNADELNEKLMKEMEVGSYD